MIRLKSFVNGLAAIAFAAAIALPAVLPSKAIAASANLTRSPKITFTFDDGLASARTLAAPTLAKYGYTGVNYVTTRCIGMTTVPNACMADNDVSYMTWAQVNELQDNFGWEIGSHTVTHPYLASTDPDEQPNKLTVAQIVQELANSKTAITTNTGIAPTSFASPYGDYDPSGNPVLAEVAKLYTSHRGFADTGYNVSPWDTTATLPADNVPLNNYLIRDQQVQSGTSVATVKSYIDKAIADNAWLVLTFHEIKNGNASTDPDDYQYNNADLDAIAAYAKSRGVLGTNVTPALPSLGSNTNLLPNSSFDAAIATYNAASPSTTTWTTDSPSTIKVDGANHGNAPSSSKSIAITSSASATHLFSPRVAVDPAKTYVSNTFVNVTSTVATGEVAFYIDEYKADGTYLTTQYKKSVLNGANPLVKNWNFEYKPTAGAAHANLQLYFSAGTTGYVDNAELFANDGSVIVTPPATNSSDLNGDGKVDALDLSTLLTNWGKTGQTAAQGNINGDAIVDALDLSTLLANWSK